MARCAGEKERERERGKKRSLFRFWGDRWRTSMDGLPVPMEIYHRGNGGKEDTESLKMV
jgi:hypothetical protein